MALKYEESDGIEIVVVEHNEDTEEQYQFACGTAAEKRRMVNRIKSEVRSSLEYEDYIAYLRENIGMDACAFFKNVSKKTNRSIKIEVHHAPLTIDDIVKIVLDQRILTGGEINDLLIGREVAKLHYRNQVGLVPLCKTIHEVVHNNPEKLVIPMQMIYGDYRQFLKDYSDAFDLKENEPIRKRIEMMIERTKELNIHSFDCLKTKFVYLQVEGFEIPVKIEDKKEIQEQLPLAA